VVRRCVDAGMRPVRPDRVELATIGGMAPAAV
jgi:uridine kinase